MHLSKLPGAVVQRFGAAVLAASVLSSTPFVPPALAAPPTKAELLKLPEGLARIDYLLENWDAITTVCNGMPADFEEKQVASTTGVQRCTKSPLRVQQFIGASSTLDPLFKADKLMIKAAPLVDPDNSDAYNEAVDLYITKQQMSATMAYTSSWSGIENPNGSEQQIQDNLLEAKREVLALRSSLKKTVDLLELPPAPPMKWGGGVKM